MVKSLLFLLVMLASALAQAAGITYHGQILKPNGDPLQGQFVGFRIRVMDGNTGTCLMYEETHTKDMRNSNGSFAIQIGDGSVVGTYNVSGVTYFDQIFRNSGTYNFTAPAGCAATPYTPDQRHGRKLNVDFRESPTDSWESMPTMEIAYVPYAFNSLVSKQVGDHTPASLLRVENAGVPSAASALTPANFTELLALLNGTTTQYVKTVSGTAGQVTVSTTSGAATIGLADVATVTAGTYGSATQVPVFTVDAKGRITGVTNTSISGGGGSGITQLTGDVTASGTGSVSATIANNAITTVKILDGNVTSAKLAASAVGSAQLAEGSVTSGKIADGAVTEVKIANSAVTANKIAADAVTSAKILNGSIIGDDISATASLNVASVAATGNIGGETMSSRLMALYEQSVNGTDYVGLKAPDNMTTGVVVFTLPGSDGTPGQVLRTDGSGNLSWVNAASGAGDFLADGTVPMTGQLRMIQGDATTPGLGLVGDTNSGIFSPAADTLAITTAGTERLRVTSSGSVGIGTNTPQVPLDVNGNMFIGAIFSGTSYPGGIRSRLSPTEGLILRNDFVVGWTSATLVGTSTNPDTSIKRNSAGVLEINNGTPGDFRDLQVRSLNPLSGNLGVGTNNPGQLLHVHGPMRLSASSAPSVPVAGDIYIDAADSNKLKWYDGAAWQSAGGSGGGGGMTQLTGDVTASGTGSVAVTIAASAVTSAKIAEGTIVASDIADDAVTFAKTQNIASGGILGRGTAGSGNIEELTLGSGLTMTGTVLSATASDTFSGLPCGNGFVPYRSAGAWTCLEATASKTNSTLVSRDSSGNFVAGSATLETSLLLKDGAAGGAITISAPIAFTGYTLTLPASAGAAGQVLSTNGAGVLSWAAAGSGGGGSGDFKADGTVAMTGALRAITGSDPLPGIASAVDPDTGIKLNTNNIQLVTNGNVLATMTQGTGVTFISTPVTVQSSSLDATILRTSADGSAASPSLRLNDTNTGIFTPGADILGFSTAGSERLRISASGSVGIGTTTPSEVLEVNGNVRAASFINTSDARLKKNITPVRGLAAINQLNGYSYQWRDNGHSDMGVLAQEVEVVFPDAVVTSSTTGYKAVKYNALIAPLIESTKELYGICQIQEERLLQLERSVDSLKSENETLKQENTAIKIWICAKDPNVEFCK